MSKEVNATYNSAKVIVDPYMERSRMMFLDSQNIIYLPKERASIKGIFREIKDRLCLAYDCLRHGRGAID